MYSTRNLMVNGGFARTPPDPLLGWDFQSDQRSKPAWRRIAVPAADRNGMPHSAYAIALESTNAGSNARLSQEIAINNVPSRKFALRVTAKAITPQSRATLVVAARNAGTPDPEIVCRQPLRLSAGWQRNRVEFELPNTAARVVIEVEVDGRSQPGSSVAFTDVRLVGLLRSIDCLAIRFDTHGDMSRASSRLRAFLLEDYLNLLGCPTYLNGGSAFDLYVCQKVQPWFGLVRAKLARKPVVFDLDDNDLLISPWRALKVRSFARMADAVSVGSKFLGKLIGHLNSRTFLLENTIDILDQEIARGDRPWGDRLVWFGMPENRWMLQRLKLDRPVTTITRGGSVEYDLKSIDQHLVASDLALLPVVLNDETRAKNANRLIKCVGLSLPFLASDTSEHRRVLQTLQLPDEFLVASERDWAERIEHVARNYARYRQLIADARPRAFDLYGVERIVADWLPMLHKIVRGR